MNANKELLWSLWVEGRGCNKAMAMGLFVGEVPAALPGPLQAACRGAFSVTRSL